MANKKEPRHFARDSGGREASRKEGSARAGRQSLVLQVAASALCLAIALGSTITCVVADSRRAEPDPEPAGMSSPEPAALSAAVAGSVIGPVFPGIVPEVFGPAYDPLFAQPFGPEYDPAFFAQARLIDELESVMYARADVRVAEPEASPAPAVAIEVQTASETVSPAIYLSGSDKYGAMSAEYPIAAEVYDRLRAEGMSDICIAGILGNMMAECGGQTLDLQATLSCEEKGVTYYGLCMWSMKYNTPVNGLDVQGQLDYLMGNIVSNMAYFGSSDGTYAGWLGSTDAGQAARDFCKYYERGSGSEQRAKNAAAAYDWICKFA